MNLDALLNTDKLYDLINPFVDEYRNYISSSSATGKLAKAEAVIDIEGTKVKISLMLEPYWINVEKGRGAGLTPPPVRVIAQWIKDKGISVPSGRGDIPPAAYAIAKSIGKNGIVPKPFFEEHNFNPRWDGNKGIMSAPDDLAQAIKNEIVRQLREAAFRE